MKPEANENEKEIITKRDHNYEIEKVGNDRCVITKKDKSGTIAGNKQETFASNKEAKDFLDRHFQTHDIK